MSTDRFFNNPEYTKLLKSWEDDRIYTEGDRCELVKTNHLWAHEFEVEDKVQGGSKLRRIRAERSRYVNYIQAIIQKYISITFQNGIDLTPLTDKLSEEELKNIDGEGNSLKSYIVKFIASDYFQYGKVIDEVVGRSGESGRAYLKHWNPQDLTDWQITDDESEYYVTIFDEILKRENPNEQPKTVGLLESSQFNGSKYIKKLYKKNSSPVAGESANQPGQSYDLIDTFETGLDFIPFTVTNSNSWVQRFIDIVKSLYNLQSAEDNILNFQAFQRLIGSGPFTDGEGAVVMESGITLLPEGFTITAIDPADPKALRERIERGKADLWRVAFFQNRIIAMDSKASESANNQITQKKDLIAALVVAGESISRHIQDLVNNFLEFKGEQPIEDAVKFNFDNLVIDDVLLNSLIAMFSQDIKNYPTWNKAVLKSAAKRMNLAEEEEVIEEIDTTEIVKEKPQSTLRDRLLNGNTDS